MVAALIDKNYGTADSLANRIVSDSGVLRNAGINRLAFGYGPTEVLPDFYSRGTPPEVLSEANKATFLLYVGHGSTNSWDIQESFGANTTYVNSGDVSGYNNVNLPVVISVGCSTGEWVPAAPDHVAPGASTPAYLGTDGIEHSFAVSGSQVTDSPVGRPDLNRQWTVPPRVAVPPPNAYDFDRPSTTFGVAWLFNRSGGGIAFCGETTVAQNNWGSDFATGMLKAWVGTATVLGDMWLSGGRYYWQLHRTEENVIGAPRCYLTYMTLFGDPSLRIL